MVNPLFSQILPPPPRDIVKDLPKVSLHDHLDGGLTPQLMVHLAEQQGYELPASTPEALAEWFHTNANAGSLEGYLECFAPTVALMQDAQSIAMAASDAVMQLAADNCVYAELRFAPELHTTKGLSMQEVVDAAIEGIYAATGLLDDHGITLVVRLILCGMRHQDKVLEVAQLTVDNYAPGDATGMVVGFDLAGPEEGFPASRFREAFELLRHHCVPVTIHAGEASGVDSIREALELGARRIGHGVRLADVLPEDDGFITHPVARQIFDTKVCLEVCPRSNYQTGTVQQGQRHPFAALYRHGIACSINTDNRSVSGVSQTDEMMFLVQECGLGLEDLRTITLLSLDAAFAPREIRNLLLEEHLLPRMSEVFTHYSEYLDTLGENTEEHAASSPDAGRGNAEDDEVADTGEEETGAEGIGVGAESAEEEVPGAVLNELFPRAEDGQIPLVVMDRLEITPFWGDMNAELKGISPERYEEIEEKATMAAQEYLIREKVALDGVHRAAVLLAVRDSMAMADEIAEVIGRPVQLVVDIVPIINPEGTDERSRYGGYRVGPSELAELLGEDYEDVLALYDAEELKQFGVFDRLDEDSEDIEYDYDDLDEDSVDDLFADMNEPTDRNSPARDIFRGPDTGDGGSVGWRRT
ncbi:Adenine deaminase [Corynebacterium ciconiae DSM 44920]|uniref:adenosine deaminase n=1 Tax=Corynebacterium ciconiae TaxID=227319 RepID=UPI00036B4807|nr:adenosine deaminase [Corynebacterium ciconiae]WKD61854.1 Adenine deaminase [Corynebacterium ciconiae DSM 44920]